MQVETNKHSTRSDQSQLMNYLGASQDEKGASNDSDSTVRRICMQWDIQSRNEKWLATELLNLMVHLGVANQKYRKILVRLVSYQSNSSNQADNYKFESSFVHTETGFFHGKSKISL